MIYEIGLPSLYPLRVVHARAFLSKKYFSIPLAFHAPRLNFSFRFFSSYFFADLFLNRLLSRIQGVTSYFALMKNHPIFHILNMRRKYANMGS